MNSSPTQRREDQGFHPHRVDGGRPDHRHLVGHRHPDLPRRPEQGQGPQRTVVGPQPLTNAKTIFADNGDYTDATIGATGTLTLSEPSLTFVANTADSSGPKVVSVLSASANTWYGAVMSQTGTCFYIKDTVDLAQTPAGSTFEKEPNATSGKAGPLTLPLVYVADGWK